MSEIKTVRSSGTLKTIDGKKYRGHLEAGETGAAFYLKGKTEPFVEWHYARLHRMDNIRRGGTSSQVTVILKDDRRFIFELDQGLKAYDMMDKHWVDKPVTPRTRGDELHRLAELRGEKIQVPRKHLITRRHPNRSIAGDIGIYLLLVLVGFAMVFPLIFLIGSSLKPLDELFKFPPTVWPQHPTTDNFSDLFVTLGQSWIPFSRYLLNTVLITFDTYWALILPAFAAPIGLFLMKQFMEGLPTALIEAAHIDGAGEFRIFWSIVMPNVKPAWLTMIIFSVQSLWNTSAATVIKFLK